ncbi:NADPH-dependent 7-cyano-7-deazaguanine reductase QueF [Desulforhopalus singaporensis]|uniref:7-cyano-7-deazaguanine reductase n=1 Tax=Desulforhopalus singaporensis TaxID=91360 RepID=A0A1H0J030_9BACT|nr:NADPH-dependent 7-cyano-7-deazaguanine reductase QueF [Desulforhopalus singaporensis]SDO36731.1 7-cyano-7-deazaguanine reductase [Desulforhopalus singaporensis]
MKPDSNRTNPLGQQVEYTFTYNPELLFPVPRTVGRETLGLGGNRPLPFFGEDIWNCWELSWLNDRGKPISAVMELRIPCTSQCIIESKSLKLYLNSFNMSRFKDQQEVAQIIGADLSSTAGTEVQVRIFDCNDRKTLMTTVPRGRCIDDLEAGDYVYRVDPALLRCSDKKAENETLCSNILRTNCPVTGQPDWATVEITYSGNKIDESSLLAYLVSFRTHTGYHENCVETIYVHLMEHLLLDSLTISGRFTRRGGVDINPCRSSAQTPFANHRLVRQ